MDLPDRNNSLSVRRALSVLEYLALDSDARGRSLSELARGVALNKSTLVRLLAPLRDHGLVEQETDTERYRLGPKTLFWAQAYLAHLDLRSIAAPILYQLMVATRETVHLVVYDHGEVIYIDKVESPNKIRMFSQIGLRMPAYCTAVGKAFLAYLPETAFDEVAAKGLLRRTPNTLSTPQDLRVDLERIRQRGFSIDDIENEDEVRCVGAPIFDYAGSVVAAISISGPATRVTHELVPELGRQVKGAAEQISQRLGFRKSRFSSLL
jgi:IclR family transcriptional regulator, acetate operon repressor